MTNALLSELADDLGVAYQSASSTSFATFLRSKPAAQTLNEDAMADLVRADVQQRLTMGLGIRLRDYVESPRVAASPVLIDAAIQAVVRGLMARGASRVEAFESIRAENLHLENEIETAQVLSSLMGSGSELPAAPMALPRRIGPRMDDGQRRYELTHQLGRGSQAVVYRAIDHELSIPSRPSWVAIKLWPRGRGVGLHGKRMLMEAMQARRVEHPGVIKVYDAGLTAEGEAYMVTPIIEGRTLEAVRQGAGSTPRGYVAWIRQVCAGVQALHAVGLLHRDLKPSNVVVDSREHAVVTDLGLAVDMEAAASSDGAGTLAFTAPEQWLAGGRTSAADVYAISATLLWCLTGVLPHGETREAAERVLASQSVHHEAIEARLSDVPDLTLRAICRRGLAYEPARRYATPEGLEADLSAWLSHEPIGWTKPTALRRLSLWRRRSPVQVMLAAAATLALAAVPAVWLWGKMERDAAVANKWREQVEQANQFIAATLRITEKQAQSWEDGCMPSLLLLEAFLGPKFLGSDGILDPLWKRQIEEARALKERAGRGTIAGMNWAILEAVWSVKLEEFENAREVMNDLLPRWQAICAPNDPWLEDVRVLYAAAQMCAMNIDREAAQHAGTAVPDFDSATLAEYEERLLRVVARPDPTRRLYYIAVNALRRLYGTTWQNRPTDLRDVERDADDRRTGDARAVSFPTP